jgi:hypothetical protein
MVVLLYEETSFTLAGYVADFCPVCGAARRFAVEQEETGKRLYMLSVGETSTPSRLNLRI